MTWSKTKIAVLAVAALLVASGGVIVSVKVLSKLLRGQGLIVPTRSLNEVLVKITPGPGGIQNALPWWKELAWGKVDGDHDPAAPPGQPGCYGIAWGVEGYPKTVLVFQKTQRLTFGPGGWYVQIQAPEPVRLSPQDLGRIQANWLEKTYATGPLQVKVLE